MQCTQSVNCAVRFQQRRISMEPKDPGLRQPSEHLAIRGPSMVPQARSRMVRVLNPRHCSRFISFRMRLLMIDTSVGTSQSLMYRDLCSISCTMDRCRSSYPEADSNGPSSIHLISILAVLQMQRRQSKWEHKKHGQHSKHRQRRHKRSCRERATAYNFSSGRSKRMTRRLVNEIKP